LFIPNLDCYCLLMIIVLLSESIQDLQSAADVLSEYCVIWDLNILISLEPS